MTINFNNKDYKLINGVFCEYKYKLIAVDPNVDIKLNDDFTIEEPKKDSWFKRLFKRGIRR